jgi:hypothetical protein
VIEADPSIAPYQRYFHHKKFNIENFVFCFFFHILHFLATIFIHLQYITIFTQCTIIKGGEEKHRQIYNLL